MQPLHIAAGVLMAFFWGVQVVAAKIGLAQLPPLLMVGMRFALLAALLAPFLRRPTRPQFRVLVPIALLMGGLHFSLVYLGVARLDGSTAAICFQLGPPFSVLVAWAWPGERADLPTLLGLALACAGVVVLAGAPAARPDLAGVLLVAGGMLCFALGTALTRRHPGFTPLELNGWIALLSAPLILMVSLVAESGQLDAMARADWRAWFSVVYTALSGGLIGFWLWYFLLARYPVAQVVPLTLLVPLFAVAASMIVLDEHPTATLWMGGALTLAGVALIQLMPLLRLRRRS